MHHLDGCRERLKRAEAHIEALYAERASWEGTMHEFAVEHDPDTGWHIFRTKYFTPPPLKQGVLASDYLHQLRATLDNLVCALAELSGTTVTKEHSFPVTLNSVDWPSAVGSQLKGLRADHIAEIASVQPYTADYDPIDHPFAVLHELNRLDKHRFLTPTPIAFANEAPQIIVRKPGIAIKDVRFEAGTPLETNREFLRVSVYPDDPDPDFNLQGGGTVYVSFGERPINVESLNRIGMAVHDFISRPVFQS